MQKPYLKEFSSRPTSTCFAHNLTKKYVGAGIYLKRKGLNHTEVHKLNHCMGEGLVNVRQNLTHKLDFLNNIIRTLFVLLILIFMGGTPTLAQDNNNGMIVRISEIEVYPEYLDEYLKYAREVAQESVKNEKDVVAIYPMSVIRNNTQIRILEIYRNQEAYKNHIASPHFKKYKEGTLHMVKHLDLVDTYQLCPENFDRIFKKAK